MPAAQPLRRASRQATKVAGIGEFQDVTTLRHRLARLALLIVAPLLVAGCGINTIPTKEERAKAQWAEVQNQYQRRSDLIPNLVNTVKGYAAQERTVLTEVTQARASATQVKVDA